jgi:uncharacterized protein YgbK (DUF1537 family)
MINLAEPMLSRLPPERFADHDREQILALTCADARTVVVLDDDPTGTQTVHGVSILTEWSVDALARELARRSRCFYILTNSRALATAAAAELNREIARNLLRAARETGCDFTVISRGDSTMRGHFPAETDAIGEELPGPFAGTLLIPAFPEGGRVTIGGVHYVSSGRELTPVAETEFARDATFGFAHSDLRRWVEEKTLGKIRAEEVATISLETLRGPIAAAEVCRSLLQLPPRGVVVVDAVSYNDLAAFVHGQLLAEAAGRRYLARTAASYVQVRAALTPRPLLTPADLGLHSASGSLGGLIVAGSHVEKTTRQLESAFELPGLKIVELDSHRVLDASTRDAEIARVADAASAGMTSGRHSLIYTSRKVIHAHVRAGELPIAQRVSTALVAIVQRLQVQPRFVIAKGGITSSDIATAAFRVRRAKVLGQIAPGIPVWTLGPESRYPGLNYIVFPGNVGTADTLRDLIAKLS